MSNPPAGSVLGVGVQTLTTTFTPARTADYSTVTKAATLTVVPATPVVMWTPAAMVYGTALGAAQLNATANTPGTFVYDPPAGTVLDRRQRIPAEVHAGCGRARCRGCWIPARPRSSVRDDRDRHLQLLHGALRLWKRRRLQDGHDVYNQTCRWDPYGNLLSITSGAPSAPAPIAVNGTQTIYASSDAGIYTGTDSALPGGGFVVTPGAHDTWLTPSPYGVIPQGLLTFTVSLESDGDLPLTVSSVDATALAGTATVAGTTCAGSIPVGATCSITVVYDSTQFRSPTELAYDTLNIHLNADAGQAINFVQQYTVVLTAANTTDGD